MDASVSCMHRIYDQVRPLGDGSYEYVKCETRNILGTNDPVDTYHQGLIMMSLSVGILAYVIIWMDDSEVASLPPSPKVDGIREA